MGYLEDRNELRYLLTNPFKEVFGVTLLKLFKNEKVFIVNKSEVINEENSKIFTHLRKNNEDYFININISKDHLIKGSLTAVNIMKDFTTRKADEALFLIEGFLKGK